MDTVPQFKAYDKKWERWIYQKDITYYGDIGWSCDRRSDEHGDVIESVELPSKEIELLQSVNVEDLNGVNIYGGDIVRMWNYNHTTFELQYIVYDAPTFKMNGHHYDFWSGSSDSQNLEVVGNIFDQPELLKEIK